MKVNLDDLIFWGLLAALGYVAWQRYQQAQPGKPAMYYAGMVWDELRQAFVKRDADGNVVALHV